MTEKIKSIREKLSIDISEVESQFKSPEKIAILCIKHINDAIDKIRPLIRSEKFLTPEDEIYFFKEVKPSICGMLFYYMEVLKIEKARPHLNDKADKKFLKAKENEIHDFILNNVEFFGYYRADLNYNDAEYFLRENYSHVNYLEEPAHHYDPKFCTNYDEKVARIRANDLLLLYLKKEQKKLNSKKRSEFAMNSPLVWTGSKTELVELCYSLIASGSVNNGNGEIKELINSVEAFFNISLGDFYRTFNEIKSRSNSTKFLDKLIDALEKKIME